MSNHTGEIVLCCPGVVIFLLPALVHGHMVLLLQLWCSQTLLCLIWLLNIVENYPFFHLRQDSLA